MQPAWLKEFWRRRDEEQSPGEQAAEACEQGVSRRSFVAGGLVGGVAAGLAAGQVAQAQAQTPAAQNPLSGGTNWWPSPWGAQDQRGANNRITPAKVMEAARLIKTGKLYPLGRVLEKGIPLFGERLGGHVVIPGGPTGGPFGDQKLHYNDELFVGEIGQAGSQFDGLGHISMVANDGRLRYYNGLPQEEVGGTYGLQKLGLEHLRPFFTRGILVDVLALKGGDRLPIDYVITVADIQAALTRQNTREPGEGDAVIFHTGHGTLWKKNNDEYNKGCPGPGLTAGRWLADRKVAVVGADTWPVEAVPGENPNLPFACHALWLTMHGIFINENLDTSELARDRVYEFAWSFNPVPIKGATGAPGNSVAIA